jgi:hypothetical protein
MMDVKNISQVSPAGVYLEVNKMRCCWPHILQCNAHLIYDNCDREWFYGCAMSWCTFYVSHKTTANTPEEAIQLFKNMEKELLIKKGEYNGRISL